MSKSLWLQKQIEQKVNDLAKKLEYIINSPENQTANSPICKVDSGKISYLDPQFLV